MPQTQPAPQAPTRRGDTRTATTKEGGRLGAPTKQGPKPTPATPENTDNE